MFGSPRKPSANARLARGCAPCTNCRNLRELEETKQAMECELRAALEAKDKEMKRLAEAKVSWWKVRGWRHGDPAGPSSFFQALNPSRREVG